MPRFDMLKMSVLRIDQEPGGHRERGVLGLVREPAEAERAANPHWAAENLARQFDNAGELRGAAAQDNSGFGLRRKRGIRKPVADHFKNLLGALPDDVR